MKQITTIGLDLAKQVFQVHGAESDGSPVVSRKLRRADVLDFFKKLSPCLVGMEACGGSHYWAREIAKFGHDVRLVPPSYVKPFVKRGKTDAADAEAICEAVIRDRRSRLRLLQGKRYLLIAKSRLLHRSDSLQSKPTENLSFNLVQFLQCRPGPLPKRVEVLSGFLIERLAQNCKHEKSRRRSIRYPVTR
jgi:transposase